MNHPDLEPLDADLDALLEAERSRPPVAPQVHDRVLQQVLATLGTGGGGGGSAPPRGAPPTAPAGAGLGGLLAKPILIGAALGGVVATTIVARPAPVTTAPAAIVATVSPVARAAPIDAPSAPPSPSPVEPDHAGATGGSASSGRDTILAAERRLLDEAQRALAEGRTAAALEALDHHDRAFPRGRLGEEREALTIRALARAGRVDEARARADRFRAAHPRSILLPAVDATVGTIP